MPIIVTAIQVAVAVGSAISAIVVGALAGFSLGRRRPGNGGAHRRLSCQLEEPFRPNNADGWTVMATQRLRNIVLGARPHLNCGIEKYNLLIAGPLKAGKSSFKNTIKSIFCREICYQEATGSDTESLTRRFTIGPIRDSEGNGLGNFRFADMPGLEYVMNTEKVIGGILEGRMSHNSQFRNGVDPLLDAEPSERNRIHCVVMVIDAVKAAMGEELRSALLEVKRQAREKGIPVAVVLTHLDQVCSCVDQDLSKTFTCRKVKDVITTVDFLGIDQRHVFVVANYIRAELRVNDKLDCLCLEAVKHLLQCCREYGDSRLDDLDND